MSFVVTVFLTTKLSPDCLRLNRFSTNIGCNNEAGCSPGCGNKQKQRHHVTKMACSTQFAYIFTLFMGTQRTTSRNKIFTYAQKLVRTERSWCCELTGHATVSAFRSGTVQSTSVSGSLTMLCSRLEWLSYAAGCDGQLLRCPTGFGEVATSR